MVTYIIAEESQSETNLKNVAGLSPDAMDRRDILDTETSNWDLDGDPTKEMETARSSGSCCGAPSDWTARNADVKTPNR